MLFVLVSGANSLIEKHMNLTCCALVLFTSQTSQRVIYFDLPSKTFLLQSFFSMFLLVSRFWNTLTGNGLQVNAAPRRLAGASLHVCAQQLNQESFWCKLVKLEFSLSSVIISDVVWMHQDFVMSCFCWLSLTVYLSIFLQMTDSNWTVLLMTSRLEKWLQPRLLLDYFGSLLLFLLDIFAGYWWFLYIGSRTLIL